MFLPLLFFNTQSIILLLVILSGFDVDTQLIYVQIFFEMSLPCGGWKGTQYISYTAK